MLYKLSDVALLEAPLAVSSPAAKANGAFFVIPLVSERRGCGSSCGKAGSHEAQLLLKGATYARVRILGCQPVNRVNPDFEIRS